MDSPPQASPACPACGEPLYGWHELETPAGPTLLQRCESCGLGLAAGLDGAGATHELLAEARNLPDGTLELRVANRDSVQARLGAAHWAALDPGRGLYPTPQSLQLLAERADLDVARIDSPRWGRGQVWMWQTLINAFTFSENFAIRLRSGLVRPSGLSERLKYAIDAVVTVLATPLVVLVSVPLELVAALTGKPGVLVAVARRSGEQLESPAPDALDDR